ncbi:MAG TPA: MmcQ/YjbR family DNA-binding protein [Candidatus Sulfotelmatobacter sp.]
MTAKDFRRIALTLPEVEERQHMDHPDFRVGGKIFATLGYPSKGYGMVKLKPEQQHYFSKKEPKVFQPVTGSWGRQGATCVHLKAATPATLRKAMEEAWRKTAPKRIAKQLAKPGFM